VTAFAVGFDNWGYAAEADRNFRRITLQTFLVFLLLTLLATLLNVTGQQEGGGDTLETRFVTLQEAAPPAPAAEEPAPAPEPEPEPPTPVPEVKPEPKPQPQPVPRPEPKVEKKPEPVKPQEPVPPTPEQLQQQAKARAQRELQAVSGDLAALRSLSGLDPSRPLVTDVASKAGSGSPGGNPNVIASSAQSQSQGVESSTPTRRQSGTGLDSRKTTVVQSPIGFGRDMTKPGQDGDKPIAGRTLEEIQAGFDRNKGAFYVLYNRQQRTNPGMGAGKIVVSLTIAPDGSVTDCKLVSSTFGDPDFEAKVIARVRLINFGAKAVPPFTYPNYPINFLPT
jgi:periplasmic protein TonB